MLVVNCFGLNINLLVWMSMTPLLGGQSRDYFSAGEVIVKAAIQSSFVEYLICKNLQNTQENKRLFV